MDRRTYLTSVGALAATGLAAGCSGDGDGDSDGENVVAVAPDGGFVFDPDSITVSTGDTVTWEFETASHNVECDPSESDFASLPDGAEAFASYDGDNRLTTDEEGTTFEHEFTVAGTYEYVCVPHAQQGMRGTVVVEE